MNTPNLLPLYSVKFANVKCDIDEVPNSFLLIEAGMSRIVLEREESDLIEFPIDLRGNIIFKKQQFQVLLKFISFTKHDQKYQYIFNLSFNDSNNFKKWFVFIKSIFSLYLKKSA